MFLPCINKVYVCMYVCMYVEQKIAILKFVFLHYRHSSGKKK